MIISQQTLATVVYHEYYALIMEPLIREHLVFLKKNFRLRNFRYRNIHIIKYKIYKFFKWKTISISFFIVLKKNVLLKKNLFQKCNFYKVFNKKNANLDVFYLFLPFSVFEVKFFSKSN